jgi:hypothetical protein
MGGDREWHTAQVRAWMLAHPDVVARVRVQDSWRLYPLALQLAARAAREQLPGVDFRLVDWETAVGQVDPAPVTSVPLDSRRDQLSR